MTVGPRAPRFGLVSSLAAAVAAAACGAERPTTIGEPTPIAASSASLGGEVVAKVGTVAIERSLVRAVMAARSMPAKAAVDVLVEEAMLAEAARRNGAEAALGMRARLDAPLTRLMLDRLRKEALAAGDWTDEELAKASSAHWQQLDRPEGRIVVHALVKTNVLGAEQQAAEMRKVLLGANGPNAEASSKAFAAAAHAFKLPNDQKPHVEELAFVADGRMLEGPGTLLPEFVKGTFAVSAELGTSEVVRTQYGFHVIRVLSFVPATTATRAERVARLEPELVAQRVKAVHDGRVAELAKARSIQLLATDQDLVLPR
jgi:parvulin-like peptidyl-prolyl isomerase